nr:hypothetical protein [Mesorhizobium sp. WSM3862]
MSGTRDENNHIIREQAPGKALAAVLGTLQLDPYGCAIIRS